MKKTAALLMALGMALPAMTLAQDADNRPPRRGDNPAVREAGAGGPPADGARPPRNNQGQGQGQGDGQRRPTPPLMEALDANHDGVIDEEEIKNAPVALRKLDKNHDGKITQDELRPARPAGGAGGNPGGPGPGAGPGQGRDGERNGPPTDGPRGPGQGPRPPQE